ncbi:hypothetical protein [Microtetraspora malaysiensis]|uniref:CopG family transcriptional regulator n=1 Tax=Microtetraspora malaysiensis TaxID=161358 RepID=A0ABW6SLD2_9ACTN
MSKQQKISQSYSLKKSTVRLVAAAAEKAGMNPSQFAEEALRFYALSHGPVGFESYEDQAQNDEHELVTAESRDNAA